MVMKGAMLVKTDVPGGGGENQPTPALLDVSFWLVYRGDVDNNLRAGGAVFSIGDG